MKVRKLILPVFVWRGMVTGTELCVPFSVVQVCHGLSAPQQCFLVALFKIQQWHAKRGTIFYQYCVIRTIYIKIINYSCIGWAENKA